MTANRRDLDTVVAVWLDEGPSELPDATRRAIVTALPTTTQARRGRLAPWRFNVMNGYGPLAAAALVAIVAGGALLYAISPTLGPGTPSPSPIVTVSPAPVVTPESTLATVTFTSAAYGYSVEIPEAWASRQAEGLWPEGGPVDPARPYADRFKPRPSGLGPNIAMAAQPLPDGTSAEAWLAAWAEGRQASGAPCSGPVTAWTDATVAGVPARRLEAQCNVLEGPALEDFLELAWVVDGSAYVIAGTPRSIVQLIADSFRRG